MLASGGGQGAHGCVSRAAFVWSNALPISSSAFIASFRKSGSPMILPILRLRSSRVSTLQPTDPRCADVQHRLATHVACGTSNRAGSAISSHHGVLADRIIDSSPEQSVLPLVGAFNFTACCPRRRPGKVPEMVNAFVGCVPSEPLDMARHDLGGLVGTDSLPPDVVESLKDPCKHLPGRTAIREDESEVGISVAGESLLVPARSSSSEAEK